MRHKSTVPHYKHKAQVHSPTLQTWGKSPQSHTTNMCKAQVHSPTLQTWGTSPQSHTTNMCKAQVHSPTLQTWGTIPQSHTANIKHKSTVPHYKREAQSTVPSGNLCNVRSCIGLPSYMMQQKSYSKTESNVFRWERAGNCLNLCKGNCECEIMRIFSAHAVFACY